MVHPAYSNVDENVILTSDKASREGSLPLTDPALITDDTETAEPLKTEKSTHVHCSAPSLQQ